MRDIARGGVLVNKYYGISLFKGRKPVVEIGNQDVASDIHTVVLDENDELEMVLTPTNVKLKPVDLARIVLAAYKYLLDQS